MLVIVTKKGRLKIFQNVASFWVKDDKNDASIQCNGNKTVFEYDMENTDIKMWYGDNPDATPALHYVGGVKQEKQEA